MVTLQKTFGYTGSNKEYLAKYFPNFKKISAEFLLPVCIFSQNSAEENIIRTVSRYMSLPLKESLQDTAYKSNFINSILIGSDNVLFFKHYISYLFGRRELNFSDYIKNGGYQFELTFNSNIICTYNSLPFIILQKDENNYSFFIESILRTEHIIIEHIIKRKNVDLNKYLDENLILFNIDSLLKMVRSVPDEFLLLIFLLFSIIKKDGNAALSIPSLEELNVLMNQFYKKIEKSDYDRLCEIITVHFDELLDFPVRIPEINPVLIKGDIKFIGEKSVSFRDLSNYDLSIDYQLSSEENSAHKLQSVNYKWSNFSDEEIPSRTILFNFYDNNNIFLDSKNINNVTVWLKLFDGTVLWKNDFSPDDEELANIHIEVPLVKSNPLGWTGNGLQNINIPLRGKVVEITGKCSLKDLTVIIQAKVNKNDQNWRVVGTAVTDITGSFTMPYPRGAYEAAQAVVSITPDDPVDVPVNADETHKAALQTISNEFLYLLVDADCSPCSEGKQKDGDCSCNKTPRLPNQEDLINSDKFSQDLGGGTCVNLTTPNRTLSEQTYYAIVRTSDPDIANYVLKKHTEEDREDHFQKVIFSLGDGKKIERSEIKFENPIRWQDVPDAGEGDKRNLSIYQAVTVAHGHLLHYKSILKSDGYSMGDLLYSLPLAPGQKKQIAVYDWKRSLQGAETQQLVQREGINASIVNDRSIINDLAGSINESLRGQSSASTGGVSAGLGIGAIIGPVGGVLGVSGGYSSSSSQASQDSARNTVQSFNEVLRNSIMQSAAAYRELNGTLIDTVTEGQQFSTTTEVVANHNHCHSLTMLYFEVLRHYAVYQELVQVEECVFVPLVMTEFTQANIRRYRDVLASNLLYRPSNSYMPLYFNQNPLIKAFDANERVLTNWANVDYPAGRYCDENIINVKGEMSVRVSLPRPKTKYDRIKSLPIVSKTVTHEEFDLGTTARSTAAAIVTGGLSLLFGGTNTTKTVSEQILVRAQIFDEFMKLDDNFQSVSPAQCIRVTDFQPKSFKLGDNSISISGLDFFENGINDKSQWESYAKILGYTDGDGIYKMLDYYFKGRLIAEWDDIFNNDIAPLVFERFLQSINIEHIAVDLTATSRYKGGECLIYVNIQGSTGFKRIDFPNNIKISSSSPAVKSLRGQVVLNIENIRITYSTNHYNGVLFSGRVQDSLLDKDTNLFIPISNEEKRDPRKEDKYIVNELISHLNSNIEYYNKILWYSLDTDRRYLLLDGFHIQVYDDLNRPSVFKSLASIVKNQLIGIAGNSLIFPVAAGVKVDRSYIIVKSDNIEGVGGEARISLFDHYRPMTPPSPYRISVPTRGIFAEAVMGACDSCEKVKKDSSQDWDKFKTDEPTAIGTVTVPTPTPTDWKAAFKDFAQPIVNIQNAPPAPAPGAGLAGLSDLLGKNGIFKDITGLDANQKNALATYLSNQENAKAFAQMAKDMAMQAHNTENADKIKTAINEAQSSGAISKEDAGKLTKDHIQQMIDGGESKKIDQQKANSEKPTLTDAAVKAVDQGKAVKATSIDNINGSSQTIEVGDGSPIDSNSSVIILLNDTPELRAFNPSKKDKSGIITLKALLKNSPPSYTPQWANHSGDGKTYVNFTNPSDLTTKVKGLLPGVHDISLSIKNSDTEKIAESTIIKLSIPQFVVISENKAEFDNALKFYNVLSLKDSIINEIKLTCDSILRTVNVRTIWKLGSISEKVPSHISKKYITSVEIKDKHPSSPGLLGDTDPANTGNWGPNFFTEHIEIYPRGYATIADADIYDADVETRALINKFSSMSFSDIKLEEFAVKVIGRLIGETTSHEILHSLLGLITANNAHNSIPIANDIMNKGADRSFTNRTGLIDKAHSSPIDPKNFEDKGIDNINRLQPGNQAKIDKLFPINLV